MNEESKAKLQELFQKQKARIVELEAQVFRLKNELGGYQFMYTTLQSKIDDLQATALRARFNEEMARRDVEPISVIRRSKK
jgi:uncharacterized protein YlxW (UPF0749 family)